MPRGNPTIHITNLSVPSRLAAHVGQSVTSFVVLCLLVE